MRQVNGDIEFSHYYRRDAVDGAGIQVTSAMGSHTSDRLVDLEGNQEVVPYCL